MNGTDAFTGLSGSDRRGDWWRHEWPSGSSPIWSRHIARYPLEAPCTSAWQGGRLARGGDRHSGRVEAHREFIKRLIVRLTVTYCIARSLRFLTRSLQCLSTMALTSPNPAPAAQHCS